MMTIQVNGESRQVTEGTTITGLLRESDIGRERVAIEVNREILDREEYDRRDLHEGDRVEIIGFIGGGEEEI